VHFIMPDGGAGSALLGHSVGGCQISRQITGGGMVCVCEACLDKPKNQP